TVNAATFTRLGTLNHNDGTIAVSTVYTHGSAAAPFVINGSGPNAMPTVRLSGNGTTITNVTTLTVGNTQPGALEITAGADVTNTTGTVGNSAGGNGFVTVTGAGSTWVNSSTLTLGNNGAATLTVSGGGSVSNTQGSVGNSLTNTASATVTGSGST